jgi:hypothetical protein
VAPPITSAPRRGAFGSGRAAVDVASVVENEIVLRASAGWIRPGTYSSRTAWKLVPPKPNALTPTERTWPGSVFHSCSSSLM